MAVLNIDAALGEMGGDLEIFEAVVETFLEDSKETISALKEAFEKKDVISVSRHAHSLKSSSRTVGGEDMGNKAEKLELYTKNGTLDNVESMINELNEELKILINELNSKGYSI